MHAHLPPTRRAIVAEPSSGGNANRAGRAPAPSAAALPRFSFDRVAVERNAPSRPPMQLAKKKKTDEDDREARRAKIRERARARLQRARTRAENRHKLGITKSRHPGVARLRAASQKLRSGEGTQTGVDTGFGKFQLSHGRGGQPKVTTRAEDFGGEVFRRRVQGRTQTLSAPPYDQASSVMSGVPNASKLLERAWQGQTISGLTDKQRLAATALNAIPHTSEDERVGGMDKLYRGIVRSGNVAKIPSLFPMVESVQHGKSVVSGDTEMDDDLADIIVDEDYYSESSDEEEEDDDPQTKRARTHAMRLRERGSVFGRLGRFAPGNHPTDPRGRDPGGTA